MSIPEFVANLAKHPLLIPNRYNVMILGPEGVFDQAVSYNVASVGIPARSLATAERFIHGPNTKVPYVEIFDDLSLTFRLSADMYERQLIDQWMTKVGGEQYASEYFDDIKGKVVIKVMHRDGQVMKTYNFWDAIPISLSDTALSQEASEPATVTVQFAYHHYEWS